MLNAVLYYADITDNSLIALLAPYSLQIRTIAQDQPVPGSYWGDAEAGLIGTELWVRPDTPVHSILHEAAHFVCMDSIRRQQLHTNAGGDYQEENGVCYLQVLWADALPAMGRARMWADMDRWGYSFRLGSSQRWFLEDAEDARAWLLHHHLIDRDDRPTGRLRD